MVLCRGLFAVALPVLVLICVAWVPGAAAQESAEQESELSVNAQIVLGSEPLGSPLAGEELDRMTEEVSGVMRCPVCQGLSVADSPSDMAVSMKNEVRTLLAAGFTPEQILTYFEKAYGEFIRLEPKAEGFNLVVWVLPILAFLAGVCFLTMRFVVSWRRRRPGKDAQPKPPPEDPSLEAYLEQVRREVGS
ncbi:MAG: cytochrome c-type biogenesis protein CcmH [bacterium]|nr:cytochrome c-type biogenesis protein CcmH [bacterium]